jgi:cytochrome P450
LEHAAKGMVQGVFFSEGEQWKRERRLISPAFNAKSVAAR